MIPFETLALHNSFTYLFAYLLTYLQCSGEGKSREEVG